MNSKWRLEELGKVVTGKTPPKTVKDAFSESGVLFLTPKDMDGRKWITSTERYLSKNGVEAVKNSVIPPGSIAVSCIGSDMGKAVMVPVQTVTNQQINTIIPDVEKCNPDYLYYLLSTKQQELKDIAGGSATPILNKGHFGKVQVYLPDLDYQLRASEILSAFDDKIQLNHQINQTLESISQALFKSWFVDFDPVKAKIDVLEAGGSEEEALIAAMQVISSKNAEELAVFEVERPEEYAQLRATAELFPAAMVESELGEIPEGWGVRQIGEVLDRLRPSKRYTKKQVEPIGDVPVFEQGAGLLLGFHNDIAGFNATPENPIFIFGDHTCITHISCQSFDISQNVIPLKGKGRPTVWTYYAIQGKQLFQEYRRHWAELIVKPIIYPSSELCEVFSKSIAINLRLKESLMKESLELSELRDLLLPKLLSGELDVSELAESLEAEA